MKGAKRTINGEKYERVRAVIAQIRDQGRDEDLKATVIARRAGVHRSFVANHFAAEIATPEPRSSRGSSPDWTAKPR